MVTHLEPDIPECEVKGALRSITMNKACEGWNSTTAIPKPKNDTVKVLHQYASKFGKLSNGHRTGTDQFSFQSQRKAMPKNV